MLLPSLPAIAALMDLDLILVLNEAIGLHISLGFSLSGPQTPAVAANSPFALNSALAATLTPTETAPNRRPHTTGEIRQFPGSTTAADNSAQQYPGGAIPCA
ncbi:hypothetical protein H6F71_26620 [Microcoleus sp. FACHB-61]|nr:hypothetical protein [Microcoleus sp. FACHB-61]